MPASTAHQKALHGVGIGLRSQHYQVVLDERPAVPWFEVLIDNYFNAGGRPLAMLERVREHYPITFHGVGMNLGGVAPLSKPYLQRLKDLIKRFAPVHVSDHLCWNNHDGLHGNDLFPIPYTRQAVEHVVARIQQVQDFLGRPILVENVSSYLSYTASEYSEAEFLAEVVTRAGCGLLCDVNNIYVSAHNHHFDPGHYLAQLPKTAVKEMHLAGYEDQGDFLLDTHGARVQEPVWSLYQQALDLLGPVPTLIEWDTNIPAFEVLMSEQARAATYMEQARE